MIRLWTNVICLIQFFAFCSSSGIIEMRLLKYTNDQYKDDKGHCCDVVNANPTTTLSPRDTKSLSCSSQCATFFRICLKQYQNVITAEPNCTYGSRLTKLVSSSKNSDRIFDESMRFPFPFAWKGDLTVIVEAWHTKNGIIASNSTNASDSKDAAKQLLLRVAEQKSLTVGHQWTKESYKNNYSEIEIEYRVICDEHYYGTDCASYCKPRDDTFGHFLCSPDGQRICMDGYDGPICNIAKCLPGCHPEHGLCKRPNECECRLGYVGKFCDECIRYPGCQHGTCKNPYDCICDEGWGGLFCNQDLNFCTHHKPCLNGATCTNTGAGHYTCSCRPGYTGTNCETKIETCSLEPCFNGATCRETGTNYTCTCIEGFSGKHCQTFAKTCTDKPCENGASCLNLSNGYMCVCPTGWEGVNCDIEMDMCQSSPCTNGGSCVSNFGGFSCLCPTGFVGQRCEVNKNDCAAQSCLNGGTCIDEVDNFKCVCPAGFMGMLCQVNVDDCIKRPCANGGTCFDLINDYKCECRPGFKGKDCSIDINECESNPCRYGATCEDLVGDYFCHCPPCYRGKDCRDRDDDCLWESTFKPYATVYNYSTSTPSYVVGHDPSKERTSPTSAQLTASLPLIIGLPLVGIFLIIMIVLIIIIFCLLRRTKSRSSIGGGGGVDDAEANKQNIANDRRAAQLKNSKDNRLSMSKMDNDLRNSSSKTKYIEPTTTSAPIAVKNSNLLSSNIVNEPKVYKIVSVDKINYPTTMKLNNIHCSTIPTNSFDSDFVTVCESTDSGLCTPDGHNMSSTSAFDNSNVDLSLQHQHNHSNNKSDSVDDLNCDSNSTCSAVLRELSMDSGLASPVLEQLSPHRTPTSSQNNTRTALYQLHRHPPTSQTDRNRNLQSFTGHSPRSQV